MTDHDRDDQAAPPGLAPDRIVAGVLEDEAEMADDLADANRAATEWARRCADALQERDEAREQLGGIRERLENLAGGLELSATATSPSRKSDIERGCAAAVREIAASITLGGGAQAQADPLREKFTSEEQRTILELIASSPQADQLVAEATHAARAGLETALQAAADLLRVALGAQLHGSGQEAPAVRVRLAINANGQPTEVHADPELALHSVIPSALAQAGYAGWATDNWELRNDQGTLLDLAQRVSDFRFEDGAQLYLNLRPGIGG